MPIRSNIPSENSITPQTNILSGSLRTIFEHSDYNVLLNNIPGERQSSYYFDVDYSYNLFRPVNQALILLGRAAIAVVQDSNYTSHRVISSRYLGSKTVSAKYNSYTPESTTASFEDGSVGSWIGDNSYGQTAAIDLYTNYFAYFEEVEDAFPKASRGSKVAISKLIDKDGKIIPLDARNTNLFDVSNIFKPNKKVFIYYTEDISGFSDIQNVLTKSVDESGFLYTTLAFYKPTQTLPLSPGNPYEHQEDNRIFYSLLDRRSISGVYVDKEIYGINNIIAQNNVPSTEDNKLYFYYGNPDSSSLTGIAPTPFTSTGYFIGMGLILRNFYPGTGEQYNSYRDYPWVRFEHISGQDQNYNININTDLLPLQIGDRFRIYDASEAGFDEAYSYDKDIFFIQNASGSSIRYTMYDSEITDIQFTLPNNINVLTGIGTSSILNENLFISSDTASIYTTTDRFATIGNTNPATTFTRIMPAFDRNNSSIDITPGTYVAGQHDETLGYGISFKKLYRFSDFSQRTILHPSATEYKYWALGTSGSLYRSTNTLQWKQVDLPGMHVSCSLNSLFYYPDAQMSNNPDILSSAYATEFKRGVVVVVGDSGSIYYSIDFGNNFSQLGFPRTDINLYDVSMVRADDISNPTATATIDVLLTVGSSGSIYITSASYDSNPELNPDLANSWVNLCAYDSYIYDGYNVISDTFPASHKRENMNFKRISPFLSSVEIVPQLISYDYFLILNDSGSVFGLGSNFNTNSTYYNNISTPGILELLALTGSFINSLSGRGYTFPGTANFVDISITGSVYLDQFTQLGDPNYPIKALIADRNGFIYLNNDIVSSSFGGPFTGVRDYNELILTDTVNVPFNEIRLLNSINYNTNQLEPYYWIPTSNGVLLSQSVSLALAGGTQTWATTDPIVYFTFISSSLGRVEPHTNFYSIMDINDYNPFNPFNSIYVQLTFRNSFDPSFYNPGGSSEYPYGINAGFPNYVHSSEYTGTRQAFRLYRRYSNEQYVLTKEYVNNGKGFIIPENYNPNLNYIELAKKAGLIT